MADGLLVLAAEFDIEKGSSVSFIYPENSPITDEHPMLAEWMLPEGSHLHTEDSTFFILNRKEAKEKIIVISLDESQQTLSMIGTAFVARPDWMPLFEEEQCINVQGSKISIIMKKNLDRVSVSAPQWDISGQECSYTANSLLLFPHTSPPLALRFNNVDERIYFTEFIQQYARVQHTNTCFPLELEELANRYFLSQPPLYVLNLVGTRQIPGAKRGARVKSIAVGLRKPWVHIFKPVLMLALDNFFESPELSIVATLYESLYTLNLHNLLSYSFVEKKVARSFLRKSLAHFDQHTLNSLSQVDTINAKEQSFELIDESLEEELPVFYGGIRLPIKIPMVAYDTEMGEFSLVKLISFLQGLTITCATSHSASSTTAPSLKFKNNIPFLWHPHLDLSGSESMQSSSSPFMILLFALLTEKRVMFVGHGKPCKDVGNCVLSSIAIASGGNLVPGVVERCYPYACLANLDQLLKTPGYVAGVTNPVFAEQPSWWDLCIDLSSNKMIISTLFMKTAGDSPKENSEHLGISCSEDDILIQQIDDGLKRHIDETDLRQTVYAYIEKFIDSSSSTSLKSVAPCWVNRMEGWIGSNSFKNLQQRGMRNRRSIFFTTNIQGLLHKLSIPPLPGPRMFDPPLESFFLMDKIVQGASDPQLLEILSLFSSTDGACLPFSLGLCHERPEVHLAAARIISRLFITKLGPRFCNPFIKHLVLHILAPDAVFKTQMKTENSADSSVLLDFFSSIDTSNSSDIAPKLPTYTTKKKPLRRNPSGKVYLSVPAATSSSAGQATDMVLSPMASETDLFGESMANYAKSFDTPDESTETPELMVESHSFGSEKSFGSDSGDSSRGNRSLRPRLAGSNGNNDHLLLESEECEQRDDGLLSRGLFKKKTFS